MSSKTHRALLSRAAPRVLLAVAIALSGLLPLLAPRPEAAAADSGLINVSVRYTYAALNADLTKLKNAYPALITTGTAGVSAAGRKIPYIKLGKGAENILVIASLHAREHITAKYIMLCAEEYCKAFMSANGTYGAYDMKALLMKYTVWIVPCANPDGLEIVANSKSPSVTITGFSRAKYKANAEGVDLNRNFPLAWNRIDNGVAAPANTNYKGGVAGSEPETKALMTLCKKNRFSFLLSFHITGECVYWGDTYNTTYNSAYKAFAKKITNVTGFYLTPESTDPNAYGGGFENWFRHAFHKPGLCVELIAYDYTTSPTTNADFTKFSSVVNWSVSRYILPAAMS